LAGTTLGYQEMLERGSEAKERLVRRPCRVRPGDAGHPRREPRWALISPAHCPPAIDVRRHAREGLLSCRKEVLLRPGVCARPGFPERHAARRPEAGNERFDDRVTFPAQSAGRRHDRCSLIESRHRGDLPASTRRSSPQCAPGSPCSPPRHLNSGRRMMGLGCCPCTGPRRCGSSLGAQRPRDGCPSDCRGRLFYSLRWATSQSGSR